MNKKVDQSDIGKWIQTKIVNIRFWNNVQKNEATWDIATHIFFDLELENKKITQLCFSEKSFYYLLIFIGPFRTYNTINAKQDSIFKYVHEIKKPLLLSNESYSIDIKKNEHNEKYPILISVYEPEPSEGYSLDEAGFDLWALESGGRGY